MSEKLHTRFRYAKVEDASAIAYIFATAWQHAYRGIIPYQELNSLIHQRDANWWKKSIIQSPNLIVMMFDGLIIGYAGISTARGSIAKSAGPKVGEITELYIEPGYQGVGLGKKLFKASWRELKNRGLTDLVIWGLADNQKACEFYQCLGGQEFANDHARFGETRLKKLAFKWSAQS